MNCKRLAIFVTLAALIGASVAYGIHLKTTPSKNEIRYNGDAYIPQTLTIELGTTVTFTNTSNAHHWPASDLHPHHSLYSDFDPKRGLAPGESWEFTFNEAGSWGFHNHLQSYLGGRVVVFNENEEVVLQCETNPDTPPCWTQELEKTLERNGPEAALHTLSTLYRDNEAFRQDCHRFTHDVGLKTYVGYGTDFSWPAEVSYCNAGFMHGYLEGYLNDKTDLVAIDNFCIDLTSQLSKEFPSVNLQCRHGIGHGYGEHLLYTHTELWNDPATLYAMAGDGCAIANHTDTERMVCAYGALTVIHAIDTSRADEDIPKLLSICELQTKPFMKEACYWGTPKFIPDTYDREPSVSIQSLVQYFPESDTQYFTQSLTSITNMLARPYLNRENIEIVDLCRSNLFSLSDQATCLTGMTEGLLFSGTPSQEHHRALTLCEADGLSVVETQSCYETVVEITYAHNSSVTTEVCSLIPPTYVTDILRCAEVSR